MGKEHIILPWLSARDDPKEGRFIKVGSSLLLSKNFQKLSAEAKVLYLCMAMESGLDAGYVFSLPIARKYGFGQSSFRRCVDELKDNGYITHESGGETAGENEYEFSDAWKGSDKGKEHKASADYYIYINSKAWRKKRSQRLLLDNYRCQMCGSKHDLNVHHMTYERLGNERMEDLVTLCRKCHAKVHESMDYEKNYKRSTL